MTGTKALTVPDDRQVAEKLAEAWKERIAVVHSDMAVKAIELKLGFVEDLINIAGYKKSAKGMGPIIESAAEIAGWDPRSVYDCIAMYDKYHRRGARIEDTASEIYEEHGSWRKALGRGDDRNAVAKTGKRECAHCPIHCP